MAGVIRKLTAAGDDNNLWDQFRSGSEEAYAIIYEKYVDTLYSYGCRINSDKELVKDCLQDLFVNLWNSHHTLGPTTSIKYYLFRSLRREIARKLKQHQTSEQNSLDQVEYSFEDKWIETEEQSYSDKVLEKALEQLSDRQREAIYLKFYQNMEFDEIASLLDITPRAVYKLIYRAIDVLQENYFSSSNIGFSSMYVSYPKVQLITVLLLAILSGINI